MVVFAYVHSIRRQRANVINSFIRLTPIKSTLILIRIYPFDSLRSFQNFHFRSCATTDAMRLEEDRKIWRTVGRRDGEKLRNNFALSFSLINNFSVRDRDRYARAVWVMRTYKQEKNVKTESKLCMFNTHNPLKWDTLWIRCEYWTPNIEHRIKNPLKINKIVMAITLNGIITFIFINCRPYRDAMRWVCSQTNHTHITWVGWLDC